METMTKAKNLKSAKNEFDSIIEKVIAPATERMEQITRYQTKLVIKSQNLTAHHGAVTFTAMILSDYLNDIGLKNDTGLVLRMAIVHDLGEIVAGDINFNAKYEHGKESDQLRESLKKLEKKAIREFLDKLGMPEVEEKYQKLFEESEAKSSIESRIVKLADHIDVILYSMRERKLGNEDMKGIEENTRERYSKEFLLLLHK